MLLKNNTPLETGLLVLALACLLTISFGFVGTIINNFLVALTYCCTGGVFISKTVRFRSMVNMLIFVVWLIALGLIFFAAIATVLKLHWEVYTIWLAGILIFLSAGQHVLLQKQS